MLHPVYVGASSGTAGHYGSDVGASSVERIIIGVRGVRHPGLIRLVEEGSPLGGREFCSAGSATRHTLAESLRHEVGGSSAEAAVSSFTMANVAVLFHVARVVSNDGCAPQWCPCRTSLPPLTRRAPS